MNYDVTLKDLMGSGAPALLRQLTGQPVAELLPVEFPSVRSRRPDLVARLADGRLYHLEVQSGPDGRMAWRMLEYYGLIAERHGGTEVVQQVLQVGDRMAPGSGALARGIDHPNLAFHYKVVDIREIDAGPLLDSPAIEDNILAVLCRCDDLRGRVRDILGRACRLDAGTRQRAATRLLALSGLRGAERLVYEEIMAMPIRIDLSQNPFLYDILKRGLAEGEAMGVAKGMEKGMAQGMAQGMAIGKVEGRIEAQAEMLLRLLTRRFGPVPPATADWVRQADSATLGEWLDRVLDAPTLDAVLEPLPEPPPSSSH